MTCVYGTLGFTPDKLLPSIRTREDVTDVCVFHDDHERSRAAAREVEAYCRDLGVDFQAVEVDAFHLAEAARAIQQALKDLDPADVVVNVTGGTKVLTASAILVCVLEGLRAVYVHGETGEEVPLPLLTVRYDDVLSGALRRVLAHIAAHPGCTQADLRDALDRSKPTISQHVRTLVDHGVVEERPDPDDARRKLLRAVPTAGLLLGAAT